MTCFHEFCTTNFSHETFIAFFLRAAKRLFE
jgi:hypothetical protein